MMISSITRAVVPVLQNALRIGNGAVSVRMWIMDEQNDILVKTSPLLEIANTPWSNFLSKASSYLFI